MPSTDETLLDQMSSDPWFGGLDLQLRCAMLSCSTRLQVNNCGFVFRKGDAPSGLYALVTGMLKASNVRADGKEAVLAVLEPANWFGEASSVDGLPRTHDVSALGAAEVLVIESGRFDELFQRDGFARAVAALQARHTRVTYAGLDDATLHSVRVRVARRLQRLARGDATMGAAERRHINITHDTLAMMLGVTRQTLALELKYLASQGAIRLGYRRIEIESMQVLRAIELAS